MKRPGLLILFLLTFASVKSQDTIINKRFIIGTFSEVGLNQPIRLTRKYVTEDVGPFHGNESVSMGLTFSRMITQKLRLEIATGYSIHKCGFELSPPIYPESKIYPETIKTFTLSASVYKYFRRNFFINFGPGVDLEVPRKSYWIDSQNGFGFNLSVGKEFVVRNFEIDLSPNLEMHSILPFHSVKGQQRLFVLGLKAGIRFYSIEL
jgi:hypothetical protein